MAEQQVARQNNNVVVNFVKASARHPKVVTSFVVYLIGIYALFFVTGYAVTPETRESFDKTMARAESIDVTDFLTELYGAQARLIYTKRRSPLRTEINSHQQTRESFAKTMARAESIDVTDHLTELYGAQAHLYEAKEWFWWFDDAKRKKVHLLQEELAVAEANLAVLLDKRTAIENQAKKEIGLFSEYGVASARDLFWKTFRRGKQAAQDMTWWDFLFGITMGRDEGLSEFLIRMVLSMLMNLTIGMFYAVLAFMVYLWQLIQDYQPSFFEGLVFFLVGSSAALSGVMSLLDYQPSFFEGLVFFLVGSSAALSGVMSLLVGVYGTVGGCAYLAVQSANNQQRLQYQRQQQQGYAPQQYLSPSAQQQNFYQHQPGQQPQQPPQQQQPSAFSSGDHIHAD